MIRGSIPRVQLRLENGRLLRVLISLTLDGVQNNANSPALAGKHMNWKCRCTSNLGFNTFPKICRKTKRRVYHDVERIGIRFFFLSFFGLGETDKGMVRSDRSKPALIFFFTARVHTTKSTVKILAANTHYKYFLKIAEHCQYCNLPDHCRNVHP
jgi:hypothetical protein